MRSGSFIELSSLSLGKHTLFRNTEKSVLDVTPHFLNSQFPKDSRSAATGLVNAGAPGPPRGHVPTQTPPSLYGPPELWIP